MDQKPQISEAEMEVLKALWEQDSATVRALSGHFQKQRQRSWAYTTIQTLLNRLESKGYVTSDKSGFVHVYRALETRENVLRRSLRNLAEDLCDGASTPLVMALVDKHKFSKKELEVFRKLVERIDASDE